MFFGETHNLSSEPIFSTSSKDYSVEKMFQRTGFNLRCVLQHYFPLLKFPPPKAIDRLLSQCLGLVQQIVGLSVAEYS